MKKLTMAVLIKCVLLIQIIGLNNIANGEIDRNARAIYATTEQPEITMQLRGDEHDVCFHNCEMNEVSTTTKYLSMMNFFVTFNDYLFVMQVMLMLTTSQFHYSKQVRLFPYKLRELILSIYLL